MNWLKVLVAFSAVLVAGCAAYFSVTGLGVLFSGASVAVMVMAGSLEFAKLVTASYLKQKWDEIQILFKIYLTTAVVILMVITSAGIFGYLSNAFQQQNLKIDQVSREIAVWQQKIEQNDKEIDRYNKQLEGQIKIRESQEENIRTSTSAGRGVSRYSEMVKRADGEITRISNKITELNESNAKSYEEINKIKNDNLEIEREVGGFRFVADAFGLDLNYVVKLFIFLIVFVFDPLALALVIAFNQLNDSKKNKSQIVNSVSQETQKKELYEVYGDKKEEEILKSENDYKVFFDALANPPLPNEKLTEAVNDYKEELQNTEMPDMDNTLESLKASPLGTKSEIVVDGKLLGYDTDGDGLVDEPYGRSSIHAREIADKKPYYARPGFDWSDKNKWINDQNAVNYWLKYKRREQENANDNIKTY
jgi:hypothetical protein